MSDMENTVYTDSGMRDRLVSILQNDSELFKTIESLKPNSKILIDVSDKKYIDYFLSNAEQFRTEIRKAIYSLLGEIYPDLHIESTFEPLKVEFTTSTTILLHDINPENHENTPIAFNCEIIAGDSWKTYIKSAKGVCPKCHKTYNVKADFDKSITDILCESVGCKFSKVPIDKKTIVTGYVQTLVIQEPLEEAKHNNPVNFEAKIYDKDVGNAFPGQKKHMTGIFHSKIGKENEHDIFIEITSMNDMESDEILMPTDEEINKYKADSKNDDYCSKLIGSFAPTIYSNKLYEDIKLSILLQLVGGKIGVKRSDSNQLLVGDPSMAKSVLLQFAKSVTQKSLYTSGKGSTSAGLTIGIVTLDSGRKVAMAGVLPICNNGFAMIDEFDKMSQNDRSSIHEAMEQQTTSIAKAGIIMTLPTKTSILAAANPIGGKYDEESSIVDNINLPATILSRFDLIWLIVDKVDETYDELKADHILNDFMDEDLNSKDIYLDVPHLTAYLNYARTLTPKISESFRGKVKLLYRNLRTSSKSSKGLAIGTRQLEGIMRLTYAHAKLMLKDEVDDEDLRVVTSLLKSAYKTLNLDLDKGESPEDKMVSASDSKEVIIRKSIRLCENENGFFTGKEFKNKLVESGRFSSEEANIIFLQLQNKCEIFNQEGNLWKRSQSQL